MNVAALVENKLEKAKNYLEQGQRSWGEINNDSYLFDRREQEAAAIKAIEKAALLAFFDECVRSLGVHLGVCDWLHTLIICPTQFITRLLHHPSRRTGTS